MSRRSSPKVGRPPPASSPATRASMRANRGRDTHPEVLLDHALQARGLSSYSRNDGSLRGTPDFVFGERRLAVFVNGCYWHRCPHCRPRLPKANAGYWEAKFRDNRARDRRVRTTLSSQGWRVMTVWECTVKHDAPAVARRVARAVNRVGGLHRAADGPLETERERRF